MSADEDLFAQRRAEVLRLTYAENLSVRAISRRLKIARKTVRKVLDGDRTIKSTVAPRPRLLLPYDGAIRQVLSDTPQMRAPAMLERLRTLGYRGGITIVRERLRQLRPHAEKEPFLTLDFKPGAAAQVDWADFGFALPGCPRRVSAFVMVMCYSRTLYLEFTLSQAMGSFLRCMERALRFFCGSTTVDIFDNMKTVVLSHTPITTVFNPTFLSYARARQFGAIACNVCRGNEKGLVERPIGFVRERFWPGCRTCWTSTSRQPPGATPLPTTASTTSPAKYPLWSSSTTSAGSCGLSRKSRSTPTTSTPSQSAGPSVSASTAISTLCHRIWWTSASSCVAPTTTCPSSSAPSASPRMRAAGTPTRTTSSPPTARPP
jgi:transposase